jgi:hypothetical protein
LPKAEAHLLVLTTSEASFMIEDEFGNTFHCRNIHIKSPGQEMLHSVNDYSG